MSPGSMEARILALEQRLGLHTSSNISSNEKQRKDVSRRLESLEHVVRQKWDNVGGVAPPSSSNSSSAAAAAAAASAAFALQETWLESQQLLEELDPGTALTHQQAIAAPILYRRQEVLAHAEAYRRDLDLVMQLSALLYQSSNAAGAGGTNISTPRKSSSSSLELVTHAPILTETRVTQEQQERLEYVMETLGELSVRAQTAGDTLDTILDQYQTLVSLVSEKMVQLDDAISRQERGEKVVERPILTATTSSKPNTENRKNDNNDESQRIVFDQLI